ncbi:MULTISPECIES: GNAT family N-acetyltransferase [unclassified Fusibacter]|uniref:GNAT family N-acetyltransferase n=1 Tax=unclassified Fusibacter TaxID=2624464 RepID=UPI0013E985C4|nr:MULTISPECIES: GNAT family N-acetyltransferase [unclassified Fusibacter]MCK8059530.1 GNAT family N-acetyltransferase [Fusibacter sp. A2]NPE21006.1 GNAT family N-acetyltransferase [Fusibacter sp. A1]
MKIRFAKQTDKDAILAFTKDTWDGYDYIHHVIDHWLSDEEGELLVAEHEGRAVALARTTHLGDGIYWLEGLRVAKEARQLGIGKMIARAQLESLKKLKPVKIRLSTYYLNHSIPIIEQMGFIRIGEFLALYCDISDKASGYRPTVEIIKGDASACLAYLKEKGLGCGMIGMDWVFKGVSASILAECQSRGDLYHIEGDYFVLTTQHAKDNILSLVVFSTGHLKEIVAFAIDKALLSHREGIHIMSDDEQIIHALKKEGFSSEGDVNRDTFVYELSGEPL